MQGIQMLERIGCVRKNIEDFGGSGLGEFLGDVPAALSTVAEIKCQPSGANSGAMFGDLNKMTDQFALTLWEDQTRPVVEGGLSFEINYGDLARAEEAG
jgi:hypothetical protein